MLIASLPEHHVQYLRRVADDAFLYLAGDEYRQPSDFLSRLFGSREELQRPAGWPAVAACDSVQVDANLGTEPASMHFYLTGQIEPSKGPRDIFRGWVNLDATNCERISGRNGYVFVHTPRQVEEMFAALELLSRPILHQRWREVNGRLGLPDDPQEFEYIASCFDALLRVYSGARDKGHYVLWAPREQ